MLDTVALIDDYHGRPGIVPYLDAILEGRAEGAFSTVTGLELWPGIRPGEEERHEALLALLERVPLDGARSAWTGWRCPARPSPPVPSSPAARC
jgi:hypothetical protein